MSARRNLTDRFIKSCPKAEKGRTDDYLDGIVPGLALRVTETGHRSFVLIARYPSNPKNPTRRNLGAYGAITLEKARDKARGWLELINQGIDPKIDEASKKAAQQRRQSNTFGAVVQAFIDRQSHLAKIDDVKTVLTKEFGKRWGARPITDITAHEVSTAIRAIVARGAPYQAHNAFGYLRRLYNWAEGTGEYGVDASPLARLKPAELIGKREVRNRVLLDQELRLVWAASDLLGAPYGPLVRFMILTGQREREIADMTWSEVDLTNALWTIPAARMKGDRSHEVPLAPDALSLLKGLKEKAEGRGDFVFSTTGGQTAVNGFSKVKARLDRIIAGMRAEARAGKGNEPEDQDKLPAWVFHDLRRTVRTGFSALPVDDLVRELVIAHAKPGLHKVYDQHSYRDEKRECLRLWERRLAGILAPPPPADVADLRVEREGRRAAALVMA